MSGLQKLNPNFKPAFDGKKIATELISKLVNSTQIEKAFLFGSCVEERNDESSDLDILLVVPDTQNIQNIFKIVNQPLFSPIATDWIIKTNSEYQIGLQEGGICRIATTQGIKIYSNDK